MSKTKILIVALILLIGFLLRLNNYSIYPQRGASSDEYTYTFLGISLIRNQMPTAWSYFSPYKHKYQLTIKNLYFPIVYPYFDHPPLSGLLVGGLSIIAGEDTFPKVELKTVRLVPVLLSVISGLLVFLLGLRLFNYKTAIIAILIYSTVTLFVINSRVVFAENLLIPIALLAIYLFSVFKKFNIYKSLLLGFLCGLAFWTKEVGIFLFLSLFYLLVVEKIKPKFVFIFSVTSAFLIALYFLYGAYFDWEVFQGIWSVQSSREIGPQTLLLLLSTPVIVNKVYLDGWYYFGIMAMFFALQNYEKNKILLVPTFAYFMILIFSLTKEGEMGWYMIPLFPFMSLFIGKFISDGLEKLNWNIFALLIFVGLSQIKFLYEDNFGLSPTQFRVLLLLMFAPFIFSFLFKREKLYRILSYLWFSIFILGNIFLSYNYIHPS